MRLKIHLRLASIPAALLLLAATGFAGNILDETDRPAPIDYGRGPGRSAAWREHQPAIVPAGPPNAGVTGVFGAPVPWPIVPIHVALLPDGRVLNFGSSTTGAQGAALVYDIWSPALGTGADSHLVLPNTTATNIFCGGVSLLPGTGTVMVVGGSYEAGPGIPLAGINNMEVFTPATNTIAAGPPLNFARWYASMVALPNGQVLVAGGRDGSDNPSTIPELFDPVYGWTLLTGAQSQAFSAVAGWYYPRLFVEPTGHLIDIANNGFLYDIDPTGIGALTRFPATLPTAGANDPVAMYAPGMILAMRKNNLVDVIDINGLLPVVTQTSNIDQARYWSHMTILADGTVLVDGGSLLANELVGVDTTAEIWNPATGSWTAGASAAIPRLYHSTALLLPDASVVTAGGGDPGPVRNMNAEIYYPPYLFDSTGAPAIRPNIDAAPATIQVGTTLSLQVDPTNTISAVTLLRAGASTHSAGFDQRFFNLAFSQTGQQVNATLPGNPNVLLPGYYMVFVFQNGVPSIATIVQIVS